jgi:hypothetical protein
VLADAEHVQPHRLGESRLVDDQPHRVGVAERPVRVGRDLAERVQPELESTHGHGILQV